MYNMASSRDSSSEKFYDSDNKFKIKDEDKIQCLEDLQSSKTSNTDGKFSTFTSHWTRSKQNSAAACTLFKIKRWHLLDENYMFDPFKKCQSRVVLTPKNTLWSTFANAEDEEVSQSAFSVDALLSLSVVEGPTKGHSHSDYFNALLQFDRMLAPLDISTFSDISFVDRTKISTALRHNMSMTVHRGHAQAYTRLIHKLQRLFSFICDRKKVPEEDQIKSLFEDIFAVFQPFFEPQGVIISCDRSIFPSLEPATMPIKLKDQSDISLVISSEPDLFLVADREMTKFPGIKPRMIAVIEVKQATRVKINNSGDGLSSLTEEDEDEDDDITKIERLEKMIESPPPHLVSIKTLPRDVQIALKRFLPELIGEMWVISRCDEVQSFQSDNGLLFGIGIVGFEVYFITTLDTTRKDSGVVINDDSAYTDVVVSGPFNLFVRQDRRKIFKALAAAFIAAENEIF